MPLSVELEQCNVSASSTEAFFLIFLVVPGCFCAHSAILCPLQRIAL
jgi:hypothetical protein